MTNHAYLDADRRHDFVLFFDVTDGNPNGDPDAGNLPRVDPETMQGLVTDVAIKRKVRDFVDVARGREGRYKIYDAGGRRAQRPAPARLRSDEHQADRLQASLRTWTSCGLGCATFPTSAPSTVMSTKVNCDRSADPLNTFARSVDPIVPLDVSVRRIAVTDEGDAVMTSEKVKTHTRLAGPEMGRKAIVPYGLYRAHGFHNPHLARQTGFQSEDLGCSGRRCTQYVGPGPLDLRPDGLPRRLLCFLSRQAYRGAPAHRLFERIQVVRREGIAAPRAFGDYLVTADEADLPEGITLSRLGV